MEPDEKAAKSKKGHKMLMGLPKLKLKKKAVKSTLDSLCPVLRQLMAYLHENGACRLALSAAATRCPPS